MDCNTIAPYYRWFEYAAFGGRLQRHRLRYLDRTGHSRRALVLGDGDGRFLTELLHRNPFLQVDCIELSGRMIDIAKLRLQKRDANSGERVRFICGDARTTQFPSRKYDLIVTHFFLDCFSEADVNSLIHEIALHSEPGALWVVSEFCKPTRGWRAVHAEAWLRTMYLFFRLTSRLRTQRLPRFRHVLASNRFTLLAQETSMAQFVSSELWEKREG